MEMLRDANWVLSVGTFLPLAGVVLLLGVPKANEQMIKMVALLTSIATLAVGIFTLTKFDFDKAGSMQFVAEHEWIPLIKSSYLIGLDGISLPLYILSMVITLLVVIYSLNHVPDPGNPKAFFILMLVLQTGMANVVDDLIFREEARKWKHATQCKRRDNPCSESDWHELAQATHVFLHIKRVM